MRALAKAGTLLLLCALFLGASVRPTSEFYVNDYAGVISPGDNTEILAIARQLEQDTGAQVAVLTVENLEGQDISAFAYETAESWGIGSREEDNGVLILLAVEDRMSRIEVGYGLEGTLTDIMTGRVQDNYMLPHYSDGDFSTGLKEGVRAVASLVYQHYDMEPPETVGQVEESAGGSEGLLVVPLLLILLLVLTRGRLWPLLFFPRGGGRGGSGGGFSGGSFGRGGGFGGGGSSRRF